MNVPLLRVIFILFMLVLFSCERKTDTASCEILLQVSSMEFYEGCTIPISVLAKDGNSQVDGVSLTINNIVREEVAAYPYIFYCNTAGYEPGEYEILASFASSDGTVVSDEIEISILPVCVTCPDEVTDFEGNHYPVVRIGNQCWMAENMRSTTYADGTPMIDGSSSIGDSLLSTFSQPAEQLIGWYFSYEGDSLHAKNYGYLYNWPTVVNGVEVIRNSRGFIQGIAPEGWHIPEVEEWRAVIDYLGGIDIAGARLKDLNSSLWSQNSQDISDASGFAAFPGGFCLNNTSYQEEGESAYFWTASPSIVNHAYHILLSNHDSRANVLGHQDSKRFGYSLRCVMNSSCLSD